MRALHVSYAPAAVMLTLKWLRMKDKGRSHGFASQNICLPDSFLLTVSRFSMLLSLSEVEKSSNHRFAFLKNLLLLITYLHVCLSGSYPSDYKCCQRPAVSGHQDLGLQVVLSHSVSAEN